MDRPEIYTVGHSTHMIDFFLELIRTVEINCIVDVRSVPASAYSPQYNQNPLKNFLNRNGVEYLHFAEEFGARRTDSGLLDGDGKLDFEKVRRSKEFNCGVERIWHGVKKGYRVALMCSESEPLECHRYSMVSIGLENEGFDVTHIMKDKSLKTNSDLERELLKKYKKKISQSDLFAPQITAETQFEEALRLINKEIGFSSHI